MRTLNGSRDSDLLRSATCESDGDTITYVLFDKPLRVYAGLAVFCLENLIYFSEAWSIETDLNISKYLTPCLRIPKM
jgi:hypothetical protein